MRPSLEIQEDFESQKLQEDSRIYDELDSDKLNKFHSMFASRVDKNIPKTFYESAKSKAQGFAVGFFGTAAGVAIAGVTLVVSTHNPIFLSGSLYGGSIIGESITQADMLCRPEQYCYTDAINDFKRQDEPYQDIRNQIKEVKSGQGFFQSIGTSLGFGQKAKEIKQLRGQLAELEDGYHELFSDYKDSDVAKNFNKHANVLMDKITLQKEKTLESTEERINSLTIIKGIDLYGLEVPELENVDQEDRRSNISVERKAQEGTTITQ